VLIEAARENMLSVAEILLQAGADVNHRDRGWVCDGDVWDTTQMDMQYTLCRLTSLHFTSLHFTSLSWFRVFSSVLFLCLYFMSIFMFMFIVCECVISLSCYYLSG
jgi:hypothetical protein